MAAKNLKSLNAAQFLSISEVAQRTSYHKKTIERFIRSDKLKSVKINGKRLILVHDFLSFLESSLEDGELNLNE